jgi:IS6 family transposase
MLAERGVNVDHTTIYRWVQRYAPEMEKRLRWYWRNPKKIDIYGIWMKLT